MKVNFLSTLLTFSSFIISCTNAEVDNTIRFSLKGDVPASFANLGAERVNIGWSTKTGKYKTVSKNVLLADTWTQFKIDMDSKDDPKALEIEFLNAANMTTANGVVIDRNVKLDIDKVFVRGRKILNLNRYIGGDIFDRLKFDQNSIHQKLLRNIRNGEFDTSGKYFIPLPTEIPTDDCDNPLVKANIVCFELRGDVGLSAPGNEERVRIAYQNKNRKTIVVYEDYTLSQDFERFMVKAPLNEEISRVSITFLNDRLWQMDKKITLDANVILNPNSVKVNHVMIKNISPHIGGSIRERFVNKKDYQRLGAVTSGIFAWEGEYFINMPSKPDLNAIVEGCSGSTTEPGKQEVCFALKGLHAAHNRAMPEVVNITYTLSNGKNVVSHPVLPLNEDWNYVKISTSPNEKVQSVLISWMNSEMLANSTSPTGIEFNMEAVSLNGEKTKNLSPCYDTIPIKNGKLLIHFT